MGGETVRHCGLARAHAPPHLQVLQLLSFLLKHTLLAAQLCGRAMGDASRVLGEAA